MKIVKALTLDLKSAAVDPKTFKNCPRTKDFNLAADTPRPPTWHDPKTFNLATWPQDSLAADDPYPTWADDPKTFNLRQDLKLESGRPQDLQLVHGVASARAIIIQYNDKIIKFNLACGLIPKPSTRADDPKPINFSDGRPQDLQNLGLHGRPLRIWQNILNYATDQKFTITNYVLYGIVMFSTNLWAWLDSYCHKRLHCMKLDEDSSQNWAFFYDLIETAYKTGLISVVFCSRNIQIQLGRGRPFKTFNTAADDPKTFNTAADDPKTSNNLAADDPKTSNLAADDPKTFNSAADDPKWPPTRPRWTPKTSNLAVWGPQQVIAVTLNSKESLKSTIASAQGQ